MKKNLILVFLFIASALLSIMSIQLAALSIAIGLLLLVVSIVRKQNTNNQNQAGGTDGLLAFGVVLIVAPVLTTGIILLSMSVFG